MSIETLKLALEALDTCDGGTSGSDPYQRFDKKLVDKAITALRQAIAEAEQAQPVVTAPCKGMNCGCTDGLSHSLECQAEHAAAIAGGVFVKAEQAQPVAYPPLPEPVADWVQRGSISTGGGSYGREVKREGVYTAAQMHAYADAARALYTAPPPRQPWVGLTDEEQTVIMSEAKEFVSRGLLDSIETKLKEKNT